MLVLGGALLLAAKGIFAKLLYEEGVALEALLALRASLSWPLIWGWAAYRHELGRVRAVPVGALRWAMLGGLSGY